MSLSIILHINKWQKTTPVLWGFGQSPSHSWRERKDSNKSKTPSRLWFTTRQFIGNVIECTESTVFSELKKSYLNNRTDFAAARAEISLEDWGTGRIKNVFFRFLSMIHANWIQYALAFHFLDEGFSVWVAGWQMNKWNYTIFWTFQPIWCIEQSGSKGIDNLFYL